MTPGTPFQCRQLPVPILPMSAFRLRADPALLSEGPFLSPPPPKAMLSTGKVQALELETIAIQAFSPTNSLCHFWQVCEFL